jgi:hypothetical protein
VPCLLFIVVSLIDVTVTFISQSAKNVRLGMQAHLHLTQTEYPSSDGDEKDTLWGANWPHPELA